MAAANTDKIRKKKSNFSTTLNGSINASDATIVLNSASGLPTDTAITLTIDRVDANGASTPTKKERVTGVISGNNLTNALRGEDSTSAQSHSSGAVVEDIWDGDTWNDMCDVVMAEHNQDGTHKNTTVALLAGAQTFTGAKTFGAGLLLATGPKITTSINDANGNEVIKTPATASAINEITVTNAAIGGAPLISATGDDTNIDLSIQGKGTGNVKLGTALLKFPNADGSANQVMKTDGAGALGWVAAASLSSKVITSSRDMTAATGDVAYTGVGFVPSSILLFADIDGGQLSSNGVADSTKASTCVARYSATGTYTRQTGLSYIDVDGANNKQVATVKSYDADGFTLTWTKTGTPTGTLLLTFICFK